MNLEKLKSMKKIKFIDLNALEQQLDGEPEPKAPILSNRYDYNGGKCGYVIPDGYEFDSIKEGFKTEIIIRPIKPQYPKTYKECCDILKYDDHLILGTMTRNFIVLLKLQKLIICRNTYWKVAGEELGLNKPWEPDWENETQKKYCIFNMSNNIRKGTMYGYNLILAFPTEEIRDVFYENFKDLIEQCKELL